jgi:hypothetical protein
MNLNDVKKLFPPYEIDDFEHVLGHVSKAAGKLHGIVGDADHIKSSFNVPGHAASAWSCARIELESFREAEKWHGKPASVYIADLIIFAAKLAALCPSGAIDLEKAVADRVAEGRNYLRPKA